MRRNMSDRPLHSQCNYISFKRLVAKQGEKPPSKGQFFALLALKLHTFLHIRQRGEIHVVESRLNIEQERCPSARIRHCKSRKSCESTAEIKFFT